MQQGVTSFVLMRAVLIFMNISSFQPFTQQELSLSPKRIDIWRFSLASAPQNADSIMDQAEINRADRFYFAKHQRRFLAARTTLRLILAYYANIPASNLVFTYNQYGKPALQDVSFIQFNLSHSADLALLAVGMDVPLGIDLEFFSARPYQGISEQLFSPQENKGFNHLPQALKPLCFFHIWAQKEAFIKACGLGLHYPVQQITVPTLPPTDCAIMDPMTQKKWQLRSFTPHIGCHAALCYDPSVTTFRHFNLQNRF